MITKKTLLIILFIQIIVLTTFAQEDKGFGLKGGTSHYTYIIGNQNESEYIEFEKFFRHGMFVSFFYDAKIGPFGLRAEMNVVQKGVRVRHLRIVPIGANDDITVETEENIRLGYLELGLLGKQNGYRGEKLNWDILFGPSIGYAMIGFVKWNEKKEYSDGSIIQEKFSDLIDYSKTSYRRIDIGFYLVSELSYRIADKWAIVLDLRYQINITNINEISGANKIRNNGFGMLLGFKKFI